jgi:hypothetical protein
MDNDGSGEVDFEEFHDWWMVAKNDSSNKWVSALTAQLESYHKATEGLMGMMGSGNTDGSMANVEALLTQLPSKEPRRVSFAASVQAVIEGIWEVKLGRVRSAGALGVSEGGWARQVSGVAEQVLASTAGAPTEHVLLTGLGPELRLGRLQGLLKSLRDQPKSVPEVLQAGALDYAGGHMEAALSAEGGGVEVSERSSYVSQSENGHRARQCGVGRGAGAECLRSLQVLLRYGSEGAAGRSVAELVRAALLLLLLRVCVMAVMAVIT